MATRKEIKAVMKQAAKYRKEGMSNHEALVKAWEGHKGKKRKEIKMRKRPSAHVAHVKGHYVHRKGKRIWIKPHTTHVRFS
jgi:thiaminase